MKTNETRTKRKVRATKTVVRMLQTVEVERNKMTPERTENIKRFLRNPRQDREDFGFLLSMAMVDEGGGGGGSPR